jgi:hypothetical protein
MATRKARKGTKQVKRMARGARKGAKKVGRTVARTASKARTKAAGAFGAMKSRFNKKKDEEE